MNLHTRYAEVKGTIVRMLDRGVVVEMADGIEGFVPVSKLTAEYIKVPADFKVGDEILQSLQKSIKIIVSSIFLLLITSKIVSLKLEAG